MRVEKNRIAELDGLRGIAILSVILFHSLGAPLLWAGVDMFFVLSGFLITGILIRRKELGGAYFSYFYTRRARRILVPYLLLLTVSSLLFGTAWVQHWYWFAFFATNIASVLHQVGHDSLSPLWSLAVEEQFYLVWPFVVLMATPRALLRISIVLVIAAPILRAVATPWFATNTAIYCLTPFRMDLLASGAIVAWVYHWNRPLLSHSRIWPQLALAGAASLVVALGLIDPSFRTAANTVRGNTFIYVFTNILSTSFLIIALNGEGVICYVLRNPVLRYIGTISYSMYLIHQTAFIIAGQLVANQKWPSFGLGLALTVGYATATWYGFERRLLTAPVPPRSSPVVADQPLDVSVSGSRE